eukprot:12284605-Alexandrium_andersonii.AAC.1
MRASIHHGRTHPAPALSTPHPSLLQPHMRSVPRSWLHAARNTRTEVLRETRTAVLSLVSAFLSDAICAAIKHRRSPCKRTSKTAIVWKKVGGTRISFALNMNRANNWMNSSRDASVEVAQLNTRRRSFSDHRLPRSGQTASRTA